MISFFKYNISVPHDGGNTTSWFAVVHVWGSGYEMGKYLIFFFSLIMSKDMLKEHF